MSPERPREVTPQPHSPTRLARRHHPAHIDHVRVLFSIYAIRYAYGDRCALCARGEAAARGRPRRGSRGGAATRQLEAKGGGVSK